MKFFFIVLFFTCGHFYLAQNADVKILSDIYADSSSFKNAGAKALSVSVAPLSAAVPVSVLVVGLIKKDSVLIHNGMKATGSILLSTAVTLVLKYGVNRPRPYTEYPALFHSKMHTGPYSFPSGHTSSAFATATSLSLAYPKWYVIVPSYLYACSVAYSRMYLGVHYPSDVLAGALIGAACSYASFKIEKWLTKKIKNKRLLKNKHICLGIYK
ncbi:MAG: phosphatase PAP2 family protein [Bacteroidetes bacterium]|nr:phosphatase PAP2 family protein [Bacteroidota bacterium]